MGSKPTLMNSNSAKGNFLDNTISRGESRLMIGDSSTKALDMYGKSPEGHKDPEKNDEDAATNVTNGNY